MTGRELAALAVGWALWIGAATVASWQVYEMYGWVGAMVANLVVVAVGIPLGVRWLVWCRRYRNRR